MSWSGIEGHDRVAEQFRSALRRGRLFGSYLFVGPAGIGKFTFAVKLAQALLCQVQPEEALDPCGHCPACVQVAARTHPDLLMVAKPPDKAVIPLDLFIGAPDRRMREGLCHDIALKPFMGRRKVAIVDDADSMNVEGANSLLKTLEEPPPRSVLILVGTTPARQLPTIRSRCRIIRFEPLPEESLVTLLLRGGLADAEARRLARHAGGSLSRAKQMAEPHLWEFRTQLFAALCRPVLESARLSAAVQALVDAAGREAPPRRARLHQVIEMAVDFYRHLLRATSAGETPSDADLGQSIGQAAGAIPGGAEAAAACIDLCLEAAEAINRSAHLVTLIEYWADQLAEIYRLGRA